MATRRAVVLGAAAITVLARARSLVRTLFIGNSFLRDHDVPARVAGFAEAAGHLMQPHVIVRPGSTLWGHWRRDTVQETLTWGWDAVVLQDHSTEALWEDRRARSAGAAAALVRATAPARAVLVVPWSRAAGHRLYGNADERGYAAPRTPAEMTARNMEHWTAVAQATGAELAPLADVFAAAQERGASPLASDGYHANAAGAALAAETIWRALAA